MHSLVQYRYSAFVKEALSMLWHDALAGAVSTGVLRLLGDPIYV